MKSAVLTSRPETATLLTRMPTARLKLPYRLLLLMGAVIFVAAMFVLWQIQHRYAVTIAFTAEGLKRIQCQGINYLGSGDFRLNQVLMRRADGTVYSASTTGETRVDAANNTVTNTYSWGETSVTYSTARDRLNILVSARNTSSDTVESLWLQPFVMHFPRAVREYDGSIPLLAHNIGNVAAVKASSARGAVFIVAEEVDKPVMIGLPWADDRPRNTVFPLSIHTGRVKSYPDSAPLIPRPIPPGGNDQFHLSLRFGPAKSPAIAYAADVYQQFGKSFPMSLRWPDRRPIGAIFLASSHDWSSNPRGWLNDSQIDVRTAAGLQGLKEKILAFADSSIKVMREMNAQGAVTWDLEGQEFTSKVGYVGDPQQLDRLAPEMSELSDQYFSRFQRAGLRVGLYIRPQQFAASDNGKDVKQALLPDPTQLLIEKMAYARRRWGATLFFLGYNTDLTSPNPIDAEIIKKLAARFPDCLIIPEHSNLRYYAYSAPYRLLNQGSIGTTDAVHATYPTGFSIVNTIDAPIDYYRRSLERAVKNGDSIMYRTWWRDPQNAKLKRLYMR